MNKFRGYLLVAIMAIIAQSNAFAYYGEEVISKTENGVILQLTVPSRIAIDETYPVTAEVWAYQDPYGYTQWSLLENGTSIAGSGFGENHVLRTFWRTFSTSRLMIGIAVLLLADASAQIV
ncbi:MAG: hypothetical protein HY762_03515 [Planctomycetes bacterium]|nr:hypothetical protein [Planctomycetota bacterium]